MIKQYGDIRGEFSNYAKSKIVILPVPYDGTSTWIKGADRGPQAILEASSHMELYDIETSSSVFKHGIHTLPQLDVKNSDDPELVVDKLEEEAKKHTDKFIVMLGGEHSITTGLVRALQESHKHFSVLQLDAHSDLKDSYMGSKYNHASVMARIKEMCPAVQVGIRSMDDSELLKLDKERMFFAKDIYNNDEWMDKAIKKLTDNVYITIDVDVFDISIMPSTGTPEPGGLGWYQVLTFLKKVAVHKKIIAFDVVELCPNEKNKAPAFLVAKLTYKLLSYIFETSNQCSQ